MGEFTRAYSLSRRVEAKCLLVNASMVGGLRDNERSQLVQVFIAAVCP